MPRPTSAPGRAVRIPAPTRRRHAQDTLLFLLGHYRFQGRSFRGEMLTRRNALAQCRLGHGPAVKELLDRWNLATPWLCLFVWNASRGGAPASVRTAFPSRLPSPTGRSTVVRDTKWFAMMELEGLTQEVIAVEVGRSSDLVRKGIARARWLLELPLRGRPSGKAEHRRRRTADTK